MIVDLFAGCGGWAEGIRQAGCDQPVVGVDVDADACATSAAAGHLVLRADVTAYPPEAFSDVDGMVASPPCQDWSQAGRGAGYGGDTGHLVDEPMRWIDALEPRWVAFEQVPPALAVWRCHAHRLRQRGYSAWTGKLCAADYGVPQTRTRAILIARRGGGPCVPAEPTHCADGPKAMLDGRRLQPWVTMADALGLVGVLHTNRDQRPDGTRQTVDGVRPAPSVTAKAGGQWQFTRSNRARATVRRAYEPAPTVAFGNDAAGARFENGDASVRITPVQAGVLQGFPADYPWQGAKTSKFRQIGNAIPPALAAAAVSRMVETQKAAA